VKAYKSNGSPNPVFQQIAMFLLKKAAILEQHRIK
jgi:hypothetical protein